MTRLRTLLIGLISTAFACGALMVTTTTSAQAMTPQPGPQLNNPLGNAKTKRVLLRQVNGSIDSAPPGSKIRISSWNMRNWYAVKSMIRAHQRGVSVQFIMDRGNANRRIPNKFFNKLHQGLARGNAGRTPDMVSFAMRCARSCRGTTGISHTKFYLFSQAGAANNVVMYGSANLTDLAATNQWNDLYTVVNDPAVFNFMQNIFNEMTLDRAQPVPFRQQAFYGLTLAIWPSVGPGSSANPVLDDLNQVVCAGAAPGTGNGQGATQIRIGITATLGQFGLDIANKLHQLWNQGCDVKIVYAVMGNNVLTAFRAGGPRGGVPLKQVVQDFNHDGVYDRYLHTKFMAISGNYAGNRGNFVTINGSSNWTPVALVSDESYGHVAGPGVFNRYAGFVNYWFRHAPKSYSHYGKKKTNVNRMAPGSPDHVLIPGVNPYSKIQIN